MTCETAWAAVDFRSAKFAFRDYGSTVVKPKNRPHTYGPRDVSMDSCLIFPYAYGNIYFF
jgi:hypothetical protein